MSVFVNAYTLTSSLGVGLDALRASLRAGRGGLVEMAWPECQVPGALGPVALPSDIEVPTDRTSRNNRLIELALRQDGFAAAVASAQERFGSARVGVAVGTSTSSIDRTEAAYRALGPDGRFLPEFRQPGVHNPHAPGDFVAERLAIGGPHLTISTACASSAKVFATAKRWLAQELVDAVVVGGADSLCSSVIHGFHSLQLIAPEPCRPFAADRQGISLGEAAGFALLERTPGPNALRLLGVGESCDAHHMSSAHPDGLGAKLAMERAVSDAGLGMADIDYVNLHGTGTRANDTIEGLVCGALLGPQTLASATKGWTGHGLGAAGIVEAILCLEALQTSFVPGTHNTASPDAPFELLLDSREQPIETALSNSFGFGGSNCTLVFGR